MLLLSAVFSFFSFIHNYCHYYSISFCLLHVKHVLYYCWRYRYYFYYVCIIWIVLKLWNKFNWRIYFFNHFPVCVTSVSEKQTELNLFFLHTVTGCWWMWENSLLLGVVLMGRGVQSILGGDGEAQTAASPADSPCFHSEEAGVLLSVLKPVGSSFGVFRHFKAIFRAQLDSLWVFCWLVWIQTDPISRKTSENTRRDALLGRF